MDAVYRIANILLGRHNQWEGEHAGGGHAVVESEHPGVYVHVRHVQEPPQLPEYFKHYQALFYSKRFDLRIMWFNSQKEFNTMQHASIYITFTLRTLDLSP